MPHLPISELKAIIGKFKDFSNIKTFIETGTYEGDTILPMASVFKQLYTIEIKPEFSNSVRAKAQSRGITNINFIVGDSSVELEELLKTINESVVFFLDGHWCGINTGLGKKDCPLLEELRAIQKLHNHNSIIIIDDLRLFGTCRQKDKWLNAEHKALYGPNGKKDDWSDITIENIVNCFDIKQIKECAMGNDRFVIYLNKIGV